MNLKKIILFFIAIISLYSCADYKVSEEIQKKERQYYSSSGFALMLLFHDCNFSQILAMPMDINTIR